MQGMRSSNHVQEADKEEYVANSGRALVSMLNTFDSSSGSIRGAVIRFVRFFYGSLCRSIIRYQSIV